MSGLFSALKAHTCIMPCLNLVFCVIQVLYDINEDHEIP